MEKTLDYERIAAQNENYNLAYYTKRTNQEQEEEVASELFINLSVREILQGISRTFIAIINEIVSGEVTTPKQITMTLFRGDRMIYTGILLVLIAFAIYVMDITGN